MQFLKDFTRAFLVGTLIFAVMVLINYTQDYTFTSVKQAMQWFMFNQIYSIPLYFVNAYYFRYLLKVFPDGVFKLKNFWKGGLGGILITVLTLFAIRLLIAIFNDGMTLNDFFSSERIDFYYIAFLISVVVTAIFYAIYYYKNKQDKVVTEQKIIAGTASAKFDALKNQLDPHFLFNSLNVLTSLIEENPDAASRFTTTLSKVYRYVLEQKNKELVTLEEELEFAKRYMSLLSVRFEDSIVYTAPSKLKNPDAKVVPLSLQLLLENAVKHNQVMPTRKLHITIIETDETLIITNNIQPKKVLKGGTGVGLQNIRDRYAILTDQPVTISKTETEFRVVIPILTKETTIMTTQDTYISEKRYKSAKKRVDAMKGFYVHFTIYLCAIPVLIYFNFLSEAGIPWAIFPIAGWGMGILGHASEVFNYNPFFGKEWERRKIREYMDKEE